MSAEHAHCWHNVSITEVEYPHGPHVTAAERPSSRKFKSLYRCCWCGEEMDESPMEREAAAYMSALRADVTKLTDKES